MKKRMTIRYLFIQSLTEEVHGTPVVMSRHKTNVPPAAKNVIQLNMFKEIIDTIPTPFPDCLRSIISLTNLAHRYFHVKAILPYFVPD